MIRSIINGFCMALADSVPGVSGGTIAFIAGIYDELSTPLKASTIKRKGSSKTLIDTGAMFESIHYEVVKKRWK